MPQKRSSLLFETTEISAAKSLGEITAVLVDAGARSIHTLYDAGKPAGLQWSMELYGKLIWFSMPAKIEPVYQTLLKQRKGWQDDDAKARIRETAERVAWRQLLMWVKVQMQLIRLRMVEYAQVFLPYVQETPDTATVWEVFSRQKFLPPTTQ